MRVAFISGPFRAANAWEIEQNIRRAEAVALDYWLNGYAVVCPHTNTRFFHGVAEDSVWLNGDLEILSRCDVVVMLPGWETSEGAIAEYDAAVQMRKRIILHKEAEDETA